MATSKTLDLFRQHHEEYEADEVPRIVLVEPAHYLSLTGKGEPGGGAFQADVAALLAVANAVRAAKRAGGRDFKVGHLETLWWMPRRRGAPFTWNLLVRIPEYVTSREVKEAAEAIARRKTAAQRVRLESLDEGECIQVLHRGAYDAIGEDAARLEEEAHRAGRTLTGPVHEIYLNGPPTPPARLRTIVRHALAPVAATQPAHGERDRLPARLRQLRSGMAPQHRARERL